MLPLEKQVCSLELAQKLKELGIERSSLFYWANYDCLGYEVVIDWQMIENRNIYPEDSDETVVSAFTVAELGEMLPEITSSWKQNYNEDLEMEYRCLCEKFEQTTWAKTEADARAKMLIYLLEHKLITL